MTPLNKVFPEDVREPHPPYMNPTDTDLLSPEYYILWL